MLASPFPAIADLYAPKRAPVDQVAFDAALHEQHFATQKARIDACLDRGGLVWDRKQLVNTPLQVVLEEAATLPASHDATLHLRLALRAALEGDDRAAGKSIRAAIESTVLHIAEINATALDLDEKVPLQFVPKALHANPSPEVV